MASADGLMMSSGYKPDTYVVASVVKKNSKGEEYCCSGARTNAVNGSTSPLYDDTVTMTFSGAPKLVFNIMSCHMIGGDTFLGQAVVDMAHQRHINDGKPHKFTLSLGPMILPVFDCKGRKLSLTSVDATGTLEVAFSVPSVYDNMAGWFWNIRSGLGLFGNDVDGDKVWVILQNDTMKCWDSPFENKLLFTVDCTQIVNLEEKVFDKLACNIAMDGIGISRKTEPELYWAWGGDSGKIRGLWNRVFKKHHHSR